MRFAGSRVTAALADELARLDVKDIDDGLREETRRFVLDRIASSGTVTRAGAAAAAAAIDGLSLLSSGRAFAALSAASRTRWTSRLATVRLPVIAEYVRLVRSLVIVHVFEARFAARGRAAEPKTRAGAA
jgi:hypothetical protein